MVICMMIPPRFKYFHHSLNIYTPVQIFQPRSNYFNRVGILKPGENILTGVQIFKYRWKYMIYVAHDFVW